TRVIDRMVLEIVGQPLPALQALAQFRVREVARDDHGPAEREPRLDRIFGELREDLLHRPAQVDMHHLTAELGGIDLGQIFRRIVLELFEIDALARDLAERLAVGRARYPEPDRKRSAVAGKADHAHVVAEIFAAELRAHAQRLRELMHLLFYREVAEG